MNKNKYYANERPVSNTLDLAYLMDPNNNVIAGMQGILDGYNAINSFNNFLKNGPTLFIDEDEELKKKCDNLTSSAKTTVESIFNVIFPETDKTKGENFVKELFEDTFSSIFNKNDTNFNKEVNDLIIGNVKKILRKFNDDNFLLKKNNHLWKANHMLQSGKPANFNRDQDEIVFTLLRNIGLPTYLTRPELEIFEKDLDTDETKPNFLASRNRIDTLHNMLIEEPDIVSSSKGGKTKKKKTYFRTFNTKKVSSTLPKLQNINSSYKKTKKCLFTTLKVKKMNKTKKKQKKQKIIKQIGKKRGYVILSYPKNIVNNKITGGISYDGCPSFGKKDFFHDRNYQLFKCEMGINKDNYREVWKTDEEEEKWKKEIYDPAQETNFTSVHDEKRFKLGEDSEDSDDYEKSEDSEKVQIVNMNNSNSNKKTSTALLPKSCMEKDKNLCGDLILEKTKETVSDMKYLIILKKKLKEKILLAIKSYNFTDLLDFSSFESGGVFDINNRIIFETLYGKECIKKRVLLFLTDITKTDLIDDKYPEGIVKTKNIINLRNSSRFIFDTLLVNNEKTFHETLEKLLK